MTPADMREAFEALCIDELGADGVRWDYPEDLIGPWAYIDGAPYNCEEHLTFFESACAWQREECLRQVLAWWGEEQDCKDNCGCCEAIRVELAAAIRGRGE